MKQERPLSSDRLHAVLTDIAYSDTVHDGALAELGCLLARAPLATIKVCTSQAENITIKIRICA